MDELVQDLASALDDSALKQDIDDAGDMSTTSTKFDRELYRKRRTRKRRTTSTSSHLVSSLLNNLVVVNQINNSPRSSSSLDEAVKDYVESLTANCSDESEDLSSLKNRLKNSGLPAKIVDHRAHHKRAFKQSKPCYCESDSHTENGSTIPVLRRHKKKKLKRMTIDSSGPNGVLPDSQGPTSGSCDETHRRKQPSKTLRSSPETTKNEEMCCKTTKAKKEYKLTISCILCYQKPCDKQFNLGSHKNDVAFIEKNQKDFPSDKLSPNYDKNHCQCNCHTNSREESSISSTSSNSDTDSANFTQDDVGGDGDDEMTDFYAESDGGPVWGVPNIYPSWLALKQRLRSSKDEGFWLHNLEESDITGNPYIFDSKIKRFVTGAITESSRRGFHARNNRLPGMAARSIRRGRRRAKVKKTKEKTIKDLDFQSSLSKLSLSARSKRMRLDGFRESTSIKQDIPSPKFISSLPLVFSQTTKEQEIIFKSGNNENEDSMLDSETAPGTSSTPNGSRS